MTPLDDAYFPRGMSHEPRWRVHPHHDSLFVLWVGYLRKESRVGASVLHGVLLSVLCHAKESNPPKTRVSCVGCVNTRHGLFNCEQVPSWDVLT